MSTTSSDPRTAHRSLALLLTVGLVIRVVFLLVHERPLFSDEREYDQLARNLATHAAYSYDTLPTAYRPVGYPALVAAVYCALGHFPIYMKFLQAIADTATSFLIYLILAGYSERTRLLGAALWCFFPSAIFFSSLLLAETCFTTGFLFLIWLLARRPRRSNLQLTGAGLILGMLVMVKPTIAAPAMVLPFVMRRAELNWRQLLAIAVGCIVALVPWLTRNYLIFGEIGLSSNGGINLLIGNNESSSGAYRYNVAPEISRNAQSEFEADHAAFRRATDYMVHHPATTIVNAFKKTGRLMESEGGILILTFHPSPEDTSTSYGAKYESIPPVTLTLTNLYYFVLVLAGLFGFLSAERAALWWISLAALGGWVLMHALIFGGGRFHFPIMPIFAIYASTFFPSPGKNLNTLTVRGKVLAFCVLTALCTLWIIESYLVFHG